MLVFQQLVNGVQHSSCGPGPMGESLKRISQLHRGVNGGTPANTEWIVGWYWINPDRIPFHLSGLCWCLCLACPDRQSEFTQANEFASSRGSGNLEDGRRICHHIGWVLYAWNSWAREPLLILAAGCQWCVCLKMKTYGFVGEIEEWTVYGIY